MSEHQQIPPQGPYSQPNPVPYAQPNPYPYPYPGQTAPQGPPPHLLAEQGMRLAARLVDGVILILAVFVTSMITAALVDGTERNPLAAILGVTLTLSVLGLYDPIQHWKWGATVGKRVCKLRVARLADGQNLSLGQAIGRAWIVVPMGLIPFLGLVNVLWCTWDKPNRQCLHDKAVSSVVVRQVA